MSSNGHLGDSLDISDLLSKELTIRAGEKEFKVPSAASPVTLMKAARWMQAYQAALPMPETDAEGNTQLGPPKGDPPDEGEYWKIVASLLDTEPAEAQSLGFPASFRVVDFLLKHNAIQPMATSSSSPGSGLPAPTKEPSPSPTSSEIPA